MRSGASQRVWRMGRSLIDRPFWMEERPRSPTRGRHRVRAWKNLSRLEQVARKLAESEVMLSALRGRSQCAGRRQATHASTDARPTAAHATESAFGDAYPTPCLGRRASLSVAVPPYGLAGRQWTVSAGHRHPWNGAAERLNRQRADIDLGASLRA